MPQIGPLELLVVGIVALVVFGPDKLPDMARSLGRALNELRRHATDIRSEFESGMTVESEDEAEAPAPAKTKPADPGTNET